MLRTMGRALCRPGETLRQMTKLSTPTQAFAGRFFAAWRASLSVHLSNFNTSLYWRPKFGLFLVVAKYLFPSPISTEEPKDKSI